MNPIKAALNKSALVAHLAGQTGVEPKSVKAVLAALEATILASVNKKGLGEFPLPGMIKISVQQVPAKKKRFGKDPFTGEEQWFAAKPASVRIKARALKKLKTRQPDQGHCCHPPISGTATVGRSTLGT
jgi:nucleoid DNA-binding protein